MAGALPSLWRGFDSLLDLPRGTSTRGLHSVTAGSLLRVGPDPRPVHTIRGSVAVQQSSQAPSRAGLTVAGARITPKTAESRRGHRPPPALTLEPAQRRTLEMGSCLVLGGLGVGFQLGRWPAWMLLAGAGIYLFWVVLYAEITVQKSRRLATWQRWQGAIGNASCSPGRARSRRQARCRSQLRKTAPPSPVANSEPISISTKPMLLSLPPPAPPGEEP
jgi:hypothetical protein